MTDDLKAKDGGNEDNAKYQKKTVGRRLFYLFVFFYELILCYLRVCFPALVSTYLNEPKAMILQS